MFLGSFLSVPTRFWITQGVSGCFFVGIGKMMQGSSSSRLVPCYDLVLLVAEAIADVRGSRGVGDSAEFGSTS